MSPREIFIHMLVTRSSRSILPSATWSTMRLESSRMELNPLVIVLIALADLHGGGLLSHHFVEDIRLPERARDERDLVLVKVGYLLEQGVDGGRLDLVRHQSHFPQRR